MIRIPPSGQSHERWLAAFFLIGERSATFDHDRIPTPAWKLPSTICMIGASAPRPSNKRIPEIRLPIPVTPAWLSMYATKLGVLPLEGVVRCPFTAIKFGDLVSTVMVASMSWAAENVKNCKIRTNDAIIGKTEVIFFDIARTAGIELLFTRRSVVLDSFQNRGFYESNQNHYLRDDIRVEPFVPGAVRFLISGRIRRIYGR